MSETQRPALIVDLSKYFGGADVRVMTIAQALHDIDYPYSVAVLDGSPVHERLVETGLSAIPVPHSRSDPRMITFLRSVIIREGFKVVDAHNPQSQFWGHSASGTLKDVVGVSTVNSSYGPEHDYSLKGRAYEQVLEMNRLAGCHFIAITAAIESYLLEERKMPRDRVSLIFSSIKMPELMGNGKNIPLMEELGWQNKFVMAHVARLEPVKAHTHLITAIEQIASDYPQFRCLIVGDGRDRDALETQVAEAGLEDVIHFAGFRNDISVLLEASDAFTLPSLSEGLPYALLEAASHHLPLLVSEVGGMAELLDHQQTGYLVPPASPDAIAEGIRWLLTHPQERDAMAQAAYKLINQKFSTAQMLSQTLKVYNPQ